MTFSVDDKFNLTIGICFFVLTVITVVRFVFLFVEAGHINPFRHSKLTGVLFLLVFFYSATRSATQLLYSFNVVTDGNNPNAEGSGIMIVYLNATPDLFKSLLQVCFLAKWVKVMEKLNVVANFYREDGGSTNTHFGWIAVYSSLSIVAAYVATVVFSILDHTLGIVHVAAKSWETGLFYFLSGVYIYTGGAFLILGYLLNRTWNVANQFLVHVDEQWRVLTIAGSLGGFSVLLGLCIIIESALGNEGHGLRWVVLITFIAEFFVILLVFTLFLQPKRSTGDGVDDVQSGPESLPTLGVRPRRSTLYSTLGTFLSKPRIRESPIASTIISPSTAALQSEGSRLL